ncbi:DUF1810 domain-containing protein [Dyella choica]|uniref:DUF1810 domain-containing protein n=1 Tax=Dyella choica TaxID=1927959 RepID=A0A432M822_9GAMM|nr:DUF1810 domain-containing protein [Dyella choica]RUL77683.1 DUF1810 domain-containing protein [Dyella choica]
MTDDPFHLQRFLDEQVAMYERVVAELRAGRKTSHWMWFIFPQIEGLGFSSTSRFFAIHSIEEARAYLRHPVLGLRLHECAELVIRIDGKSARQIFGSPDELKFRSCMTLFSKADPIDPVFQRALKKYFDGVDDPRTLERLRLH